jgi:hypothetical protein
MIEEGEFQKFYSSRGGDLPRGTGIIPDPSKPNAI